MAAIASYPVTLISTRTADGSPSTREAHISVQFGDGTSTYPTGGLSLDITQIGFRNVLAFLIPLQGVGLGGYYPVYNRSTGKLMLYTSAGAEQANTQVPNFAFEFIARGN